MTFYIMISRLNRLYRLDSLQNFMRKTCNFIASEEVTRYTETNKNFVYKRTKPQLTAIGWGF